MGHAGRMRAFPVPFRRISGVRACSKGGVMSLWVRCLCEVKWMSNRERLFLVVVGACSGWLEGCSTKSISGAREESMADRMSISVGWLESCCVWQWSLQGGWVNAGYCRADAAPLMLPLLGWAGATPACLCRCHFCAWEGARARAVGRCHVHILWRFIAVVPPVMPRSRHFRSYGMGSVGLHAFYNRSHAW